MPENHVNILYTMSQIWLPLQEERTEDIKLKIGLAILKYFNFSKSIVLSFGYFKVRREKLYSYIS